MDKQRIKELKLTGQEIVVQDNKLIDSPKTLSLQEQKLFLFLVSKLDPNNQEDIVFRISINEFAKTIGVESKTDIYRDVRKSIKNLMGKIVTINSIENGCKTITDCPILEYAKYWHGKGYADIKISNAITPYLFSLHKEFTQYKLSQITRLSSIYAIRLYEMLKKQEIIGSRTFFLDDLRKKLNIKADKLASFKDFRKAVLEISRREINEKTDLDIDFSFIKTGRKITAIKFYITSKDEKTENSKIHYLSKNSKNIREIKNFGHSTSQAIDMLDNVNNYEAENAINAVKNQVKKGNAKNPKGMIKTAIKEKWKDKENSKTQNKKQSFSISKIFKSIFR